MEYELKINSLKKVDEYNNFQDVVREVSAEYIGTDETGNSKTIDISFELQDPSDNFKPLETLTKDDVINWIENNVSLAHLQNVIKIHLQGVEKVELKEVNNLDWLQQD
jgi:hypothetical protein